MNSFQNRVRRWMQHCFGEVVMADKVERNHRFLEEALELVQACGCTQDEARKLVDYVYGRPAGETHQEIGGVMVTLSALVDAQGRDLDLCAELELARVLDPEAMEKIRGKQAAKPKMSPLPEIELNSGDMLAAGSLR